MSNDRWMRVRTGSVCLVMSVSLLACAVFLERDGRQLWWEDRGPVVPHESFPADCSLCHVGSDWSSIREDFAYDHVAETGMPLEGAHALAECLLCHNDRGPVQLFAQRGCAGCHEDPHLGQLGSGCVDCHEQETWRPLAPVADHARTRFPLVGAHVTTACWSCHPGAQVGDFANTATDCAACHADDAAAVLDPDHADLGWTSGCEACHLPTEWGGEGFQHASFPLLGSHLSADCSACHEGDVFAGLPTDCAACHDDVYQASSDPDHLDFGFGTSCEDCHDAVAWENGVFDHALTALACADCHQTDYDTTADPDHAALSYPTSCEVCHTTRNWDSAGFDHSGIVDGCLVCHQADYDGASDPDHAGPGFSTSCELCHATNSWEGAEFNHTGIVDGCAVCHQDDFDATTDPSHAASGFPNTCEDCHTTQGWDGADFAHDFPIDTGDHRGFDCGDCHLVASNFSAFSCTHCHEHRKSEEDDNHSDVDDYVWESSACYTCHPDGEKDFAVRGRRRRPTEKKTGVERPGKREPISMRTCPHAGPERVRSNHSWWEFVERDPTAGFGNRLPGAR